MVLRSGQPGSVTIGDVRLRYQRDGAIIEAYTLAGTPINEAGLDRGDRILELGGRPIRSTADLTSLLEQELVGDEIAVRYASRGTERSTVIVLGSRPDVEVVTYETAGRTVDDDVRAFRDSWLEPKGR
jgi:S1-C subfamily serine protease